MINAQLRVMLHKQSIQDPNGIRQGSDLVTEAQVGRDRYQLIALILNSKQLDGIPDNGSKPQTFSVPSILEQRTSR